MPRSRGRAVLTEAAYGFRFDGMIESDWLALRGGEDWPVVTLAPDASVALRDLARLDPERMHVGVCPQLPPDEIVHPLLGRTLTLLAEARGIDALHGGVVLGADGAWMLVGDREAGKSSLLAQCHRDGAQVLSDDIVALKGMRCLSGPRCIDLRSGAAERLGPGISARGGTKQRIRLPPAPAQAEAAGVIHLAWGPATQLTELRPAERIARLVTHRAVRMWPRSLSLTLDLASLPTFELQRPQMLDSLADSAVLLLDLISADRALGIVPS